MKRLPILAARVTLALACCVASALAQQPALKAPNVVPITASLVTSGQPPAETLAELAAQGFDCLLYTSDAADE